MIRKLRILRIWFYGKLPYAKRFRKWMDGQLFRDLQDVAPTYIKNLQEKYGNFNYELFFNELKTQK